MPVVVRCTSCHKRVGVPEQTVGRQVRCPLCQGVFVARPDADDDLPTTQPLATPPQPVRPEPVTVAPAAPPFASRPPRRSPMPSGKRKFPWAVAVGGVTVVALVTVVLLIAGGTFSGPAIPDDAWKEYRCEPGRYTVLLPGTPTVQNFGDAAGTATVLYDGKYDFHVSHADLIGRDPREMTPEQRFKKVLDKLIQEAGAKVVQERDIDFQGQPGREWELDVPGKPRIATRLYVIHGGGQHRQYGLRLAGPGVSLDAPEVRKFFDSFTPVLVQNDKPPPPPERRDALPHTDEVIGLAFADQGARLVTATESGEVLVWGMPGGERQRSVPRPDAQRLLACLALAPDGRTAALAHHELPVRFVDLGTGEARPGLDQKQSGTSQWCVAYSPDGKLLATGHGDETVRVWDVAGRQQRHESNGHTHQVLAVAFSPDSKLLASASADRTVRLWDATTGKPVATLTGHREPEAPFEGFREWSWAIRALAFSPDGKYLASASHDKTAIVWDVEKKERLTTLEHDAAVLAVAWRHDGKALATGAGGGQVALWEAGAWKRQDLPPTAPVNPPAVRALAFTPDGARLAITAGREVQLRALGK